MDSIEEELTPRAVEGFRLCAEKSEDLRERRPSARRLTAIRSVEANSRTSSEEGGLCKPPTPRPMPTDVVKHQQRLYCGVRDGLQPDQRNSTSATMQHAEHNSLMLENTRHIPAAAVQAADELLERISQALQEVDGRLKVLEEAAAPWLADRAASSQSATAGPTI